MNLIQTSAICFLPVWIAACGATHGAQSSSLKEAWNPANDPSRFLVDAARFADLPREGALSAENYPWSDDYWSTRRGGIAYRWQRSYPYVTGTYKDYRYKALTRADFTGDPTALAQIIDTLSPAEKYDLLLGRYEFPLVEAEMMGQQWAVDSATGDVPGWYGICHGWAPATLMEPEPGAKATIQNPDGIAVPFYTSDINALMSKVYADYLDTEVRFLGERCNTPTNAIKFDENGRIILSSCRDSNPGALHLVLAKLLGGAAPKGFVADIARDAEVWNQAITGFRVRESHSTNFDPASDPTARYRAPGTIVLVAVKADVSYITEWRPHREPVRPLSQAYTRTQRLEYTLELDQNGKIIGGEWVSGERPDFIWAPTAPPSEHPLLSYGQVRRILDASRSD